MKSKALILRSVSGITYSESYEVLKLAGLLTHKPTASIISSPIDFLQLMINRMLDPATTAEYAQQIKLRINEYVQNNSAIRDYIMDKFYKNTGSRIVFYQEYHVEQILTELNKLTDKERHFEILSIGGGHGSRTSQLSDLTNAQIETVRKALSAKFFSTSTVILGSCYSAAHADKFVRFLDEYGIIISDTTTCTNNHFLDILNFLQDESRDFLSVPESSIDNFRRIACTEILQLPSAAVSLEQFSSLTEQLMAIPNINEISLAQIESLKKEFLFLGTGINKLKEFIYLKDGLESHIKQLKDDLFPLSFEYFGVTPAELIVTIRSLSTGENNPQQQLFIKFVEKFIDTYGISDINELISYMNRESLIEFINTEPNASNEAQLTKRLLIQLYHLSHSAKGRNVTGKAISSEEGLSVLRLNENLTGKPEGAHADDYQENNLIVSQLIENRDSSEKVDVSSDLRLINQATQYDLFNKSFKSALKRSFEEREILEPVREWGVSVPTTGIARSLASSSPLMSTVDPAAQQQQAQQVESAALTQSSAVKTNVDEQPAAPSDTSIVSPSSS